jgi:preprotein translocase subunit SecD
MNKPAYWRLSLMVVALLFGLTYSVPNFFGELPAVQISSTKATVKITPEVIDKIKVALAENKIEHDPIKFENDISGGTIKIRFDSTDSQLKAREIIEGSINPVQKDSSYVVALNLVSSVPTWLSNLKALPMYLGLDLRGGVYFMLEVDMGSATTTKLENLKNDSRSLLRKERIRHSGIIIKENNILIKSSSQSVAEKIQVTLENNIPDLSWQLRNNPYSDDKKSSFLISGSLSNESIEKKKLDFLSSE